MALKASYEFLFFGKDDNSFLENYYYDLFQEHGEKSGQVFINVEIQNNPVDAEEIGGRIFETMQQVFFEDVQRDSYERFEIALKAVNKALSEFKGQKFSGYIGNLNVVIAAIVGNSLYLTQSGDAEAYLIRKRYLSILSEGLNEDAEKSDDVFLSIASGTIEEGDFILFSSTRLLRYISKNELTKQINRRSVTKSLESFRDAISSEVLGRIGLTGILFENASVEDIGEIAEETDNATQSMLESNKGETVSYKETLVGKFLTGLRRYKKGKSVEVFKGRKTGFLTALGNWFKGFWSGLFEKGFGKNKILAILVLVILVLAFGIWIAKSNSAERAEIERLDKILQSVQDKIGEAETKSSYNKDEAKTILDNAYTEAMTVLNSGYYREKAKLYLMQIESERDVLDNVKRITSPALVVDLSKKRSNVSALGLVDIASRLFAYEYNALYEIVLDQVQDPLTIDDKEIVIAATGFVDRGSIVFMAKSGKLIQFNAGNVSYMDTDDGAFRKGVALKDWSNRIYILDPEGKQIWKYAYKGTREAFGTAEPYFIEDPESKIDVSKAVDFAIDSNLYLLMNDGQIFKFYGGKPLDGFSIMDAPLNKLRAPSKIYTNDKLDYVYVLDSKTSRILVYIKDARTSNLKYQTQYLIEDIGEIRDILVDPEDKKMLLLTASKVFEIPVD
ncbi:MAG: hypothetical protein WC269_05100 [Candidatus Gracilibacteria bacterium]|jgi:hypothetical protein